MTEVIKYFTDFVLYLTGLSFYVFLLGKIFPAVFLRTRYINGGTRDRGIKKIVHPEGRGILYEPIPSVRKYVKAYTLFTDNGYKFFQCKTDSYVKELAYNLIQYDNRDRVVDILKVKESLSQIGQSRPILLHSSTSYISFELARINDTEFKTQPHAYCNGWLFLGGILAGAVLTFLLMLLTLNFFDVLLGMDLFYVKRTDVSVFAVILSSVLISIFFNGFLILSKKLKGVKVSFNVNK